MPSTSTPVQSSPPRESVAPVVGGSVRSGLALCLGAAFVAVGVQRLVPELSAVVVAIVLGALLANAVRIPAALEPGIRLSAKRLLRLGIVLLGLQLSLRDVAGLGWGGVGLVVAVVTVGILGTLALGRVLGIPQGQRLLIATGFSICGAAAVAAVSSAVDSDDEDAAAAVGLVILYGTAMIALIPWLVGVLSLDDFTSGVIIGGSIHEVAQVVAAGGIVGSGALAVAVIVKLARVAMLAPVILTISLVRRRSGTRVDGVRPPLLPLFVVGFLGACAVATLVPLPTAVTHGAQFVQTPLLAAAMFALGTGLRHRLIRQVGGRPVLLGALSTLLVTAVAVIGALLLG